MCLLSELNDNQTTVLLLIFATDLNDSKKRYSDFQDLPSKIQQKKHTQIHNGKKKCWTIWRSWWQRLCFTRAADVPLLFLCARAPLARLHHPVSQVLRYEHNMLGGWV